MTDFSDGVTAGARDAEYLRWIRGHLDGGGVLNLAVNDRGKFVVHRASCQTTSYDLAAAGQSARAPKKCFEGV